MPILCPRHTTPIRLNTLIISYVYDHNFLGRTYLRITTIYLGITGVLPYTLLQRDFTMICFIGNRRRAHRHCNSIRVGTFCRTTFVSHCWWIRRWNRRRLDCLLGSPQQTNMYMVWKSTTSYTTLTVYLIPSRDVPHL